MSEGHKRVDIIICTLEKKVRCPLLPSLEDIVLCGGVVIEKVRK